MKKAYVFPGQGAQFPGMGKALYESCEVARRMMEDANDILGFRLTDLMFGDDAEALKSTDVAQPAVFLHSTALAISSVPDAPDMVGGHSLGEFSALVACEAMSFEDALRLVLVRSRAMRRCCERVPGTMAAVIGLDGGKVEQVCASVDGIVVAANYNSDVQVVISGENEAVKTAGAALKAAGAKRVLPLAVSGAFHSPLMEAAREEFAEALHSVSIKAPSCPVYQNVTANPETDPSAIKSNLIAQLTSPVRWTQTVRNMLSDGADTFLEIGPGTVLQGLVKRISSTASGGEMISISGIQ